MIHDLDWLVFPIAGVVGVIVLTFVAIIVVKFRDRGQAIPEQTHGKPALEIGLTILPALILIGIAIPTVGTIMALNETDDTECIINVTGQQWWWEIDYAQQDGCGGIAEPIVTSGQMIIPINTPVLVRGTSRDVIHSWWIPRLNGKRDMVPGRVQTVRLEADEPGIYAGQCTEFCGLSHANMRMEVIALTPEDFEAWKAQQLAPVRGARSGHPRRHRREHLHRPVLALSPGQRARRRRRRAGHRPPRPAGVLRRRPEPVVLHDPQHLRRRLVGPAQPGRVPRQRLGLASRDVRREVPRGCQRRLSELGRAP